MSSLLFHFQRHNYVTSTFASKGWLTLGSGANISGTKVVSLSDSLTLTEIYSRNVTLSLSISESLTLSDQLARTVILNRATNDSIIFTEIVNNQNANETTTNETINLFEVYGVAYFRSVSDILILTEIFDSALAKFRAVNDLLVFTENFDYQRIINRQVQDQLIFIEILDRTMIYDRITTDLLNLSNGSSKYLGNIRFNINEFEAIKVGRKQFVLLQSIDNAIVLPTPKFGDSESNLNSHVIKRSMGNTLYCYVRKNELQKLVYSFEIGSIKKSQLQEFIDDNIATIFELANWKGERWKVNFGNNPIDIVSKAKYANEGEKNEVTLEFQGIRLV